MPTLNLMDAGFAHWRIWAADLRDEGGPHSEDAKMLCWLLDIYQELSRRAAMRDSANNLAEGLHGRIEQLVGKMLTAGAAPPKEAALLK